jgi:hypothetical protein
LVPGAWKNDRIRRIVDLAKPSAQNASRFVPERDDALLPALAQQLDACVARIETQLPTLQPNDLGDSGPCIVEGQEQCMIAPT